jgi:predicted nucleotide-binding protein
MAPKAGPSRLRILYCDDQERFREQFKRNHGRRFDIDSLSDIGELLAHLHELEQLPDLLLLDLYHPLDVADAQARADAANGRLEDLTELIGDVKILVEDAWDAAAVPVLQELREHFPASELPVLIYTQRGLLLLDDSDLRQIEECDAEWLIKDKHISPTTEAIRIEKFVRTAKASRFEVARDQKRVMVVHGRNQAAAEAMFEFLTALGLAPIPWEEAVGETGQGSPHNLHAVQAAMAAAQAVVVVMTAEESAQLLERFALPGDPDGETVAAGQPRPNVFFEAGLAMGIAQSRTILVELGRIRRASDLDGLNVVRLTNAVRNREALRERLRNAGCAIDERRRRWRAPASGGDFNACVTG